MTPWAFLRGLNMVALVLCGVAPMARSADEDGDAIRIRRERQSAEARYLQAQEVCRHQFAVTDCNDRAKAERRVAMDRLRHEELALDDRRRSERAAARTEAVQRRGSQSEAKAASAAASGGVAIARTGPDGAGKSSRSGKPVARQEPKPGKPAGPPKDHTAAAAAASRQAASQAADMRQRQAKLAKHRQDVQERNELQAKKRAPSAALPVPGRPSSPAASSGR